MSTRCGEALDNSTGVFITTGFLWDSVPSKFESLVKKKPSSNPELVLGLVLNYLHSMADRGNKSVKQMQAIHFKSIDQVKLPGNPMDFNWWAEMN